ncbi:MAG: GlsB/YeaQ/YmgE family stress response membrane protein [Luteimonas sp.]
MANLFGSSNWLYIILIGFVVGLLARFLKPGRDGMGIILTTLLGIAGACAAGWVGQTMGWYAPGQPAGFLGALIGAIVILVIVSLFRRKRPVLR